MKQHWFIMTVGLPGVGKTTFLKREITPQDRENTVIISTDAYIEKAAQELGLTYDDVFQTHIKVAEKMMETDLEVALKAGKHIVWDQTNVTRKARAKKLAKIPDDYCKLAIVFETPDEEEHKRRLDRPGKTIPMDVVNAMKSRWQPVTTDEKFDGVIKIPPSGEFPDVQ